MGEWIRRHSRAMGDQLHAITLTAVESIGPLTRTGKGA